MDEVEKDLVIVNLNLFGEIDVVELNLFGDFDLEGNKFFFVFLKVFI